MPEKNEILSQKFYEAYKYNNRMYNFISSGINTLVGFINKEALHSIIAVLDNNFNIITSYETNAFIHSCNISDNGKYIVWQTAFSQNSDSNSIFLFDVSKRKLLWRINAPIHIRYLNGIFVFDAVHIVECRYDDISIKYDFYGNELNPEENYKNMLKSYCVSPYYWNSQALKIIETLDNEFCEDVEREVIERINAAEKHPEMSKYQLSHTYRKLGDCYLNHGFNEKALNTYKKGIEYYSKLPVKRIIIKLEKEINKKI